MNPKRVWMVGGVLRCGGRVLLCRRRLDRSYPGLWDLPGGHVEPGEDDAAALARECREELGIGVVTSVGVALAEPSHGRFLSVRLITRWRGEPYNAAPEEHDAIGFFTIDEVATLTLADARYLPLLTQLRERRFYERRGRWAHCSPDSGEPSPPASVCRSSLR